jgi:hypothetical protein
MANFNVGKDAKTVNVHLKLSHKNWCQEQELETVEGNWAAGFLAFGFAAFFSAAGFFAAVFFGVLAFLGLAAFGFTAFFGLAASFFLGLTTSPILNKEEVNC